MDLTTTLSWVGVATVIAVCFVLGAAPVFVVRLLAHLYPKEHGRRDELVAEMAHVRGLAKTLEQWRWLGENFAAGVCDGVPARWKARRRRRQDRQLYTFGKLTQEELTKLTVTSVDMEAAGLPTTEVLVEDESGIRHRLRLLDYSDLTQHGSQPPIWTDADDA